MLRAMPQAMQRRRSRTRDRFGGRCRPRLPFALLLASSAASLLLGGCRGEDLAHDCDRQFAAFGERVRLQEQPLLDEVGSGEPYTMAMRLSEVGINRLLASVIDEGVPFAGSVPFGFLPSGPGSADFEAEGPPVVEIVEVPGCPRCVVFSLDFAIRVESNTGDPLSTGPGFAKLAIPLRLVSDAAAGTSTLVADYGDATIAEWSLAFYGFDSETHTMLSGAMRVLLEEEIRANFGTVSLMDFGSWNFGTGIVLQATDLEVRPATGEILLGMHTNLPLARPPALALDEPLPDDIPMSIAFDAQLLLAMAQRMLAEGEIPRRYDEDGRPDVNGLYGVTMEQITTRTMPGQALDSQFRIWRVDDGYCGFATAQMPLTLAPRAQGAGARVQPGAATLVSDGPAQGVGAAALEEEQLVEDNQELVDAFRASLSEQVANTLNYEALGVEGSRVLFATKAVVAGEGQVALALDLLVVAEP